MAGGNRSAAAKKGWVTRRAGGTGMAELRAEARNLARGANRDMRRHGIKARAWPKGLLEQVHGSAISRNSAVNAALLQARKRSAKSTLGSALALGARTASERRAVAKYYKKNPSFGGQG